MTDLLPVTEVDRFEARIHAVVEDAGALPIKDADEFELGSFALQEVTRLYKEIEAFVEPFRKLAKANYDGVLARKRTLLTPLAEAGKDLKAKLASFHDRQERARLEAEKAALEAARLKALAEHEAKIEETIDAGDEETAERLMDTVPAINPKDLQEKLPVAAPPKVEGTSFRVRWTGELAPGRDDSIRKLCAAIARGKPGASPALVKINQTEINRLASSLHEDLNRLDIGLIARRHKDVAQRV